METSFIQWLNVIAFDWVHRCGKWTQIKLTQNYLKEKGYEVVIIRWEGSRNWTGDDEVYFDPKSWYFSHFSQTKIHLGHEHWLEASNRIQRELLYWRKQFQKNNKNWSKLIVLTDRSILSRFMLYRQMYTNIDLASLLFLQDSRKVSIPNIIFVFSAEVNILLQRIEPNDPKWAFRRRNIETNVPILESILDDLPHQIRSITCEIFCGNKTPNDIFQEIKARLPL